MNQNQRHVLIVSSKKERSPLTRKLGMNFRVKIAKNSFLPDYQAPALEGVTFVIKYGSEILESEATKSEFTARIEALSEMFKNIYLILFARSDNLGELLPIIHTQVPAKVKTLPLLGAKDEDYLNLSEQAVLRICSSYSPEHAKRVEKAKALQKEENFSKKVALDVLTAIPSVNDKTAASLLNTFGSIANIGSRSAAEMFEITKSENISPDVLHSVEKVFRENAICLN